MPKEYLPSKDSGAHTCPACGQKALAVAGKNPECATRFTCSACGSTWREGELACCPECGQYAPAGDFEELIICRSAVGFYVCKQCYEKIR